MKSIVSIAIVASMYLGVAHAADNIDALMRTMQPGPYGSSQEEAERIRLMRAQRDLIEAQQSALSRQNHRDALIIDRAAGGGSNMPPLPGIYPLR